MKTMKVFMPLLLVCMILCSCSKDDDKDFELKLESLVQTSWHGTLIESYDGGNDIIRSEVGFIFYTEEDGQYDIKYPAGLEPERDRFTYSVNKKMLHIENNVILTGYWLLIDKDKDKMILEQSIGGEYSYKATLTLFQNH